MVRRPIAPLVAFPPKRGSKKFPRQKSIGPQLNREADLIYPNFLACNLRTYCSIVTPLRSNVLVPITKFCPSDVSCSHWQRRLGAGRQDGALDDQGARGGVGREVKARLQSEEDQ